MTFPQLLSAIAPLTSARLSIMDLSRVIIGPIVTEKAERLKAGQKVVVTPAEGTATKISVQKAKAKADKKPAK